MKKKELKAEDVTLEMCKVSDFGCRNCLYAGCECVKSSLFVPNVTYAGKPSCKHYAYYD